MPNDNQAAKSYIEAVMARADGATEGPWKALRIGDPELGPLIIAAPTESASYGLTLFKEAHQEQTYVQVCADFLFASEARQDIPTLAKMLLRAIEALDDVREYSETHADPQLGQTLRLAVLALADINALAAKGSQ